MLKASLAVTDTAWFACFVLQMRKLCAGQISRAAYPTPKSGPQVCMGDRQLIPLFRLLAKQGNKVPDTNYGLGFSKLNIQ